MWERRSATVGQPTRTIDHCSTKSFTDCERYGKHLNNEGSQTNLSRVICHGWRHERS
jgi:hypothetical protein